MINSNNNKIIDDELYVAEKFIKHINITLKKDFVLPYHSKNDNSIDALTHRESNPNEILKMEIVSSDFKAKESLGKKKIYETFRDATEEIIETILIPILRKSKRYSPDYKKDVVLLLDGWWTVTEEDLNYFKTHILNAYFMLREANFKEIWFVSEKWDGPIYRLWPFEN